MPWSLTPRIWEKTNVAPGSPAHGRDGRVRDRGAGEGEGAFLRGTLVRHEAVVLSVRADIETDHQAFIIDGLGVHGVRTRRGIDRDVSLGIDLDEPRRRSVRSDVLTDDCSLVVDPESGRGRTAKGDERLHLAF